MKCEICKEKIETIFLDKLKGTFIGRYKDKKAVCNKCQKKYAIEEIKRKLK